MFEPALVIVRLLLTWPALMSTLPKLNVEGVIVIVPADAAALIPATAIAIAARAKRDAPVRRVGRVPDRCG